MSAPGGLLELLYRHPTAAERHHLRMHVTPFDPAPVTTAYGVNDRRYVSGGAVTPTETSVLQTFASLAALWRLYYSPNWVLSFNRLYQLVGGQFQALSPTPSTVLVTGSDTADDETGPRGNRRIKLLGQNAGRRRLWLMQTASAVEFMDEVEVTPTTGGLDARDRLWVAYLSGQSAGAAVTPDGTYCFPVTVMSVEWARELLAASWVTPGAPYLVSG